MIVEKSVRRYKGEQNFLQKKSLPDTKLPQYTISCYFIWLPHSFYNLTHKYSIRIS